MNCIKNKCYFYSNSDIYEFCRLKSEYLRNQKCIGFCEIDKKKEELTCKIGKLLEEYDVLKMLKRYISSNQEV
jgi:hypothetical protein